jgi:hypothetical protein
MAWMPGRKKLMGNGARNGGIVQGGDLKPELCLRGPVSALVLICSCFAFAGSGAARTRAARKGPPVAPGGPVILSEGPFVDRHLSPDGQTAIFWGIYPEAGQTHTLTGALDLNTGVVTRCPTSMDALVAWSPDGRYLVGEQETSQGVRLVCLRMPGRDPVWTAPMPPKKPCAVWLADGSRAVVAEPAGAGSGGWSLDLISGPGINESLVTDTRLFPRARTVIGGREVILCSAGGSKREPLTVLGLTGRELGSVGPPIPATANVVMASPDHIAWQAPEHGKCHLLVRTGETWRDLRAGPPPGAGGPGGSISLLLPAGPDHLVILQQTRGSQNAVSASAVSWSGHLRPLRWPRYSHGAQQVLPWIDGQHLLISRLAERKVDFVDGFTGAVVRTFDLTGPISSP